MIPSEVAYDEGDEILLCQPRGTNLEMDRVYLGGVEGCIMYDGAECVSSGNDIVPTRYRELAIKKAESRDCRMWLGSSVRPFCLVARAELSFRPGFQLGRWRGEETM